MQTLAVLLQSPKIPNASHYTNVTPDCLSTQMLRGSRKCGGRICEGLSLAFASHHDNIIHFMRP